MACDTEVGAELQREESRRQVDSAVPESPPVHATAGNDNDAFAEEMDEEPSTHNRTARALEMKSKRITEKLRGRSRGRGKASAEYESDKEEGQKIEHGDFFNSFGEKWDSPM
ncbi:hypothetical protein EV179_003753 [Coemansia sp. RSA 487]|nr:hypothetical protein IW138_004212 [Coemansia sp. RSA 986]KAJ2213528.1 hypothetical protein EV179_003753 [Coemansia sp. RSA 487]